MAQLIEKAKQYSDITELTPEILRLFIERIMAGEKSQKHSHTAQQDLWIYYRDIGLTGTPMEPEEKEQKAELDERKAIFAGEARAPPVASTGPA